jgi:hypothetical protein
LITFKFVYFNPESDILQQSVIGFVGDEDTESVVRRDRSDEGGERSLQKNLKKLGENPNKKKTYTFILVPLQTPHFHYCVEHMKIIKHLRP